MDRIGTSEERGPLWLSTVLRHNGSDHEQRLGSQFIISHGNDQQLFILFCSCRENKTNERVVTVPRPDDHIRDKK
jgi:hypothetical protein